MDESGAENGAGDAGDPRDDPFVADSGEKRPNEADRAVEELLDLLARKHALALLSRFADDPGPWRYGELETELEISPTSLSSRLDEFEAAGLVTRTAYDENPPRVEYTATRDAEALRPVFRALYEWVETHE